MVRRRTYRHALSHALHETSHEEEVRHPGRAADEEYHIE